MGKLFGTDGVRGVAGRELSPELAFKLGRAAGRAFKPRKALIGRDTRTSGPALEAACSAGLAETGCDVHSAAIIPSPGVSHLVRLGDFDLGVVISASHNPPQDNGLKFYDSQGLKLSPAEEETVEALLGDRFRPEALGNVSPWPRAREEYLDFLLARVGNLPLRGVHIVLDCAHGATSLVAPELFRELGALVTRVGCEPDGSRINATGVMNMEPLRALVRAEGADLGIAFDGDGDRALFVDHRGSVVEGDRLIAALAPHLLHWGEIKRPAVVFTVLANMGAEEYLRGKGFQVLRVPVGDRNVSWRMVEEGVELGGEPSGHIVFGRHAPTGDGLLTGLMLVKALYRLGFDLSSLVAPVSLYPKLQLDVPAPERAKQRVLEDPRVVATIREAEAGLRGKGRLIVRPSGTQPVIRLFAEGPDAALLQETLEKLAEVIKEALAQDDEGES
ncbi:MAG TPA: phosphoglucosamine mutase [Candidatus Acetothermia bacterium]|nr:phosphoglucosamine mutase [Candidatus Acetothermia bacterium]